MVAARQPPPAAIVRAWSRALDANDNEAAAELFAPGARVIQPGVDVRVGPELAVEFNASLPCRGQIVRLTRKGNRVTSKRGLVVRWQQIPVPAAKKPTA